MRVPSRFSLVGRARSFRHAGRGLARLVASEHNARLHALATTVVVAMAWAFGVARWEWALLFVATGLVWAAEALNAGIETLADFVHDELDPAIGRVKDFAAGAVLAAALAAAAVGIVIFGPRLVAFAYR